MWYAECLKNCYNAVDRTFCDAIKKCHANLASWCRENNRDEATCPKKGAAEEIVGTAWALRFLTPPGIFPLRIPRRIVKIKGTAPDTE